MSAHVVDEYLQATRIAIDPDRVTIELDLTPGVEIARAVLAEIDRNRNGTIDAEEAEGYAARVMADLQLELDGHPLALELAGRRFPAEGAVLKGEGTIQLLATASLSSSRPAIHRLLYRNNHHTDIGDYLANALVPTSARVIVRAQHRDVNQRELVIEFELRDPLGSHHQAQPRQ